MDFGALPPEINSGRMYTGPGSTSTLAAAAAWGILAAELGTALASYESVIADLAGERWSGPSSAAMAAAVTPYLGWMADAARGAEQAAAQARAAAAAYDAAFAATVPPAAVEANRDLLMTLIATNVLGQNTAAIAATEIEYAEMWAQDAATMYGYAAASAAASALTPFSEPPSSTRPDGQAGQAAAVAHAVASGTGSQSQDVLSQLSSAIPQMLHSMAAGPAPAPPTPPVPDFGAAFDAVTGPLSPLSLYGIGGVPYLLAIQCVLLPMNGSNVVASVVRAQKMAADGIWVPGQVTTVGAESTPAPGAGMRLVSAPAPTVSAGAANAASVGRLSVPQAWASGIAAESTGALTTPGTAAAASLAVAEGETGMLGNMALGSMAGRALGVAGGATSTKGRSNKASLEKKAAKPSKATIIVIPPSARD